MNKEIEFELDDNTQSLLNNQLIIAIFNMLYKKSLINKKEHNDLLSQLKMTTL